MKVVLALAAIAVLLAAGYLLLGDSSEPRPWEVKSDPKPSDSSFQILIDSGGCNTSLTNLEIEETSDEVTVTPYVDIPGSDDACLTYLTATVELDEPVGTRTLSQGE